MSQMVYAICTRFWEGWRDCARSWDETAIERHPYITVPNMPIPQCFQAAYEGTTEPIISYIHDDVVIHEKAWDQRILHEFEDPGVGLVGFAGALGHGLPQMYKEPFKIPNLIRRNFISNLRDAERHGARVKGERTVAVLDGLALFVRRSVLDAWGGWPDHPQVGYFLYCEHLCCEVRRQGLKIRMVGIDCSHLGGKSSGTPLHDNYDDAHRHFYTANRDVLPFYVEE